MSAVGVKGGGATAWEDQDFEVAPRHTPGSEPDEECGTELRVVAKHGRRNRADGAGL